MTQRERLAAVLHDVCCEGYERDAGPHDSVDNVFADALLARGVRVVDDPNRFDQDERDAVAEAEFLRPIR